MTGAPLRLQRADEATLSYVETRLEANGLPSQDVRSKPDCFYIGYDGDERIGVVGIELYGTDGLLRSVVVEETVRGQGYGAALCAVVETEAQSAGVDTLYLLTTNASSFFVDLGYVEIDRSTAPRAIQQTTEFDDICPSTATCMKKSL
ncbi:arsenic resistance N-acetyltransferase ArsN2 [Halorubrum ezzemoulense]|uniref:arsenic resistance N-acetyltransferase ArsN2 n=1 Tax=Halorubrum ezzemoulense TaxID=337243 RepID=UPI00232BDF92|nr:arsenic resistance N-acetyltransferase ArsN2 [Halorubrum ezzemoulense]MDB2283428.1 arsenic resistance N-acetyltransferase ArsN2 [Halorubrum ezzemoulense]